MATNKLRPCPFCGDEATRFCDDYLYNSIHGYVAEAWIECESCGARGPRVGIDEIIPEDDILPTATKEWNERG